MKRKDSEITTYYNYKERDPYWENRTDCFHRDHTLLNTIYSSLLSPVYGSLILHQLSQRVGGWEKVSLGDGVLLQAYRQLISGLFFPDSKHTAV